MLSYVDFNCTYCNKECKKSLGQYNKSIKASPNIYCSRACAGKAKRTSKEEKIEVKRLYDVKYREENKEKLKKSKAAYNKKVYAENPEKYKEIRKRRYKAHLEYLQTPEYKAWKKEYDKKYHAKKKYGEYWESSLLIELITGEYDNREIKRINNLTNKSQIRKRKWKQKSSMLNI